MIELRLLRYFLAVAEEGSFTRAAARLYVSQPTLSQQIRVLEKAVGGQLFDRGSGLRLTPAGHALITPAQRALASVAEGIQAVRDTVRPDSTILRIGHIHGAAGKMTASILETFIQEFPDVQLVFRESTPSRLYNELLDDELDVGFTRLPLHHERHAWTVLFEEPRILAVGRRHPLAAATTVTVQDILDLPMPQFQPARPVPEILAHWALNDYRNGCPPHQSGGPVRSAQEVAFSLMREPATVAVSVAMMRQLPPVPPPLLRFVDLTGVSGSAVVVARRRHDLRPAVTAFTRTAETVARQLSDGPDGPFSTAVHRNNGVIHRPVPRVRTG